MSNQSDHRARSVASYLDFVRDARTAWKLLWDSRVPLVTKAIPFLSLAYVLMPVDLLPDLALGLGQLDDLAILLLGLKLFVQLAAPRITGDAKPGSEAPPEQPFQQGEIIDSTYRFVDEARARRDNAPAKRE